MGIIKSMQIPRNWFLKQSLQAKEITEILEEIVEIWTMLPTRITRIINMLKMTLTNKKIRKATLVQ